MPAPDLKTDHPIALRCALEWVPAREVQAAANDGAKGRSKNRRFRMVAYTGGVASIGWYGPSVFDMDTMDLGDAKARHPSLLNHDTAHPVGFTDRRAKEGGEIVCEGELFAGLADADHVLDLADRGFPWQASVWLEPGSREYLDPGAKATVNGREFVGPLVIHRNTRLKEQTFCALGGDPNTSTSIAATRGGSMSTPASPPAPAQPAESSVPAAPPTQASAPPAQAPAPVTREEFSAILAERPAQAALVAQRFAAGDSAATIRAAAAKADADVLAAKDRELEQLRAKVAQPGIGFNGAARQAGEVQAAAPEPVSGDDLERQAKAAWDGKPALRAEFANQFRYFLAECRHSGQVKE